VGALSEYLILDVADEKGAFCSGLLADMGARVTRVDLEEKDREKFLKLVTTADVLIETFSPGYLDSLGLGYTALSKINPRLVMASITPFGQTGPYKDFPASDLTLQALGGWLSVTGEPRMPLKLFGNQAYFTASLFAANGILLALFHRHITGLGQYLDISIMECVASTLDHALVRYFYQGVVPRRQGNRHWSNAFRIFPCKDGFILLSVFQQWETLVEWLASEGMAADLTDAKWRDRETRAKAFDHIEQVLERWTLTHSVDELVEKGQLMRFPWAKVTSVLELFHSPQLAARGYFNKKSWSWNDAQER
jgi:crotonobetainyl-CoA:carnitine CoA-transferase CaiB-like acyl-CoA transferase